MDNEEITITERIVEILSMTFKAIDKCYDNNNEKEGKANYSKAGSRLLFPKRRDKQDKNGTLEEGECRISEQELRFAFIEQFNAYCNKEENKGWEAYYSVETPTTRRYSFKEEVLKVDEKGCRSGNIDVCIHNNGIRICLLEFKALNPNEHSYQKDFFKLNKEKEIEIEKNPSSSIQCFFVQLLKNQDRGTNTNIDNKIKEIIGDVFYISHTIENGKTDYYSKAIIEKSIINSNWNEIK